MVHSSGIDPLKSALVVQWIGHSPAKGEMQVRFLPRAQRTKNPALLQGFLTLCQPETCFASRQNGRGRVVEFSRSENIPDRFPVGS